MAATRAWAGILPVTLLLSACQATDDGNIFEKPVDFLSAQTKKIQFQKDDSSAEAEQKTLNSIVSGSAASVNMKSGFKKVLSAAVLTDPRVIAQAHQLDARRARLSSLKSTKEVQFSGTLYGGVEDVSDDTKGVAAVLRATRVLYDSGKIDSQIAAEEYRIGAAEYLLQAQMEERILNLLNIWIDLDTYEKLNAEIEERLLILDPLISQLEKVAKAGLGDVTQVAAAQRTVSAIRVTQTDIAERLERARIAFVNEFGELPQNESSMDQYIFDLAPSQITQKMAESAPLLRAQYASYLAAEADLLTVRARKGFDFGFEAQVSKPFGGSSFESEEKLGFVWRKNFYDGGQIEADEVQAVALVSAAQAQIESVVREGGLKLNIAKQSIKSMDEAIILARENIKNTSDEIAYLRKQLVIGGSTLDNVLAAEARLYEAESNLIGFIAQKNKSKVVIASSLGLITKKLKVDFKALDLVD